MFGDSHIHMILDGVYYRAAIDSHKEHPIENVIRSRLSAYREAGITFLRDGGDAWNVGLTAARIAPEYGIDYRTPVFPIHKKGHYGAFIGRGYETMSEAAVLMDEAKRNGADFIKIMISGLMDFSVYGKLSDEPLAAAEIKVLIDMAHDRGLAVMAHANGARTVQAAAEAGVDSVEHGAYLDADALHAMAEHGTVWVPTLVTIGNLIGCGRFPDEVLKPLLETQQRNVGAFVRMGGSVALGSDAGAYRVPHVQGAADEYMYLRQAIGDAADAVLEAGEERIRSRFRKNG